MRKKSFTLIEILIALSLASLVMGTLFFWYRHFNNVNHKLQKQESIILEERYFEQRLNRVFSGIHQSKEDFVFFSSENNGLIFHFDNGSYVDPKLSGTVLAKLYVNPKNHFLYLGLWSKSRESEPALTIPLISQVSSIDFSFYNPPENPSLTVHPDQIGPDIPKSGWQNIWKQSYKSAPEFIKLNIHRFCESDGTQREIEWVFELKEFRKPLVITK